MKAADLDPKNMTNHDCAAVLIRVEKLKLFETIIDTVVDCSVQNPF